MNVPSNKQIEPGSSIEENKILVEKFLKAIDDGNPTALDEYVAEDYIWHGVGVGEVEGRENWKQVLGTFLQGFPDMKLNIHELLGERDKVVYRYTWTGTHQNVFQGISPTSKQVTVEGVGILAGLRATS